MAGHALSVHKRPSRNAEYYSELKPLPAKLVPEIVGCICLLAAREVWVEVEENVQHVPDKLDCGSAAKPIP